MAETPQRIVRISDELMAEARETVRVIVGAIPDDAVIIRAGIQLIVSGEWTSYDLAEAIRKATLKSGWPAREERQTPPQ